MKVTTISYQKVFPIAQFTNERIGMEASLDEKEDAKEAMERLKALVESCHVPPATMELNTDDGFYSQPEERPSQPERTAEVPKTREGQVETIKKQIESSPDLITLKAYHLLAKKYPEIQEAYDKKLKEFQ